MTNNANYYNYYISLIITFLVIIVTEYLANSAANFKKSSKHFKSTVRQF